ncbi:hypothetical protein FPV67DRAFT_1491067 [Lyophyllum atratum]|nr:hypothetical protein FPV67DRAFT_1491067 [Lyophyllum atratum]
MIKADYLFVQGQSAARQPSIKRPAWFPLNLPPRPISTRPRFHNTRLPDCFSSLDLYSCAQTLFFIHRYLCTAHTPLITMETSMGEPATMRATNHTRSATSETFENLVSLFPRVRTKLIPDETAVRASTWSMTTSSVGASGSNVTLDHDAGPSRLPATSSGAWSSVPNAIVLPSAEATGSFSTETAPKPNDRTRPNTPEPERATGRRLTRSQGQQHGPTPPPAPASQSSASMTQGISSTEYAVPAEGSSVAGGSLSPSFGSGFPTPSVTANPPSQGFVRWQGAQTDHQGPQYSQNGTYSAAPVVFRVIDTSSDLDTDDTMYDLTDTDVTMELYDHPTASARPESTQPCNVPLSSFGSQIPVSVDPIPQLPFSTPVYEQPNNGPYQASAYQPMPDNSCSNLDASNAPNYSTHNPVYSGPTHSTSTNTATAGNPAPPAFCFNQTNPWQSHSQVPLVPSSRLPLQSYPPPIYIVNNFNGPSYFMGTGPNHFMGHQQPGNQQWPSNVHGTYPASPIYEHSAAPIAEPSRIALCTESDWLGKISNLSPSETDAVADPVLHDSSSIEGSQCDPAAGGLLYRNSRGESVRGTTPAANRIAKRGREPESDDGQPGFDDGVPEYDDGEPGFDDGEFGFFDGVFESDDGEPGFDDGESGSDDGELQFDDGESGFDDDERQPKRRRLSDYLFTTSRQGDDEDGSAEMWYLPPKKSRRRSARTCTDIFGNLLKGMGRAWW